NRTDFDLGAHTDASGTKMQYFDQAANERYTPYVVEPSFGLTRSMMAFLVDAYTEDEAPNTKGGVDKRTVLKLDPRLAPLKVAAPAARTRSAPRSVSRSTSRLPRTRPSPSASATRWRRSGWRWTRSSPTSPAGSSGPDRSGQVTIAASRWGTTSRAKLSSTRS